MKRRSIATLVVAVILTVVSIVIPALIRNQIINAQDTRANTTSSISAAYALYTIKEYEGKIAVFEAEASTPLKVYDTYVSNLPEYDRLLLSIGIKVNSKEELSQRIEDFTS